MQGVQTLLCCIMQSGSSIPSNMELFMQEERG